MKIRIEELLKDLNQNQTHAVKIENNAVITAGAGSGKTKVLASRYVYLVVEKNIPVENIIALTFTDKAAGEMHKRIYDTLKNIDHPNAVRAVEKFHLARISTLDSFCNSIARLACKNFGISPDFIIDNTEAKKLAYRISLDFFLTHRTDKTLQFFLSDKSIESFIEDLCLKLLTKYVYVSKPLDFMQGFKAQKEYYVKLKQNALQEILSIINVILDHANENNFFTEAVNILESSTPASILIDEEKIEALVLMLEKIARSRKGGDGEKEIKSSLKKSIAEIESVQIFENAQQYLYHLFELLTELQTEYLLQKKQTGVLTFADVSRLAVDALIEDVEFRNFYKKDARIIMIDEFQDTNSLQRDLLFLLAEKLERADKSVPCAEELIQNKLFFVGDEKQSIYAFRGADVSVFRKLSSEISSKEEMETARLAINYRTEPALIDLFNIIFSQVFYPAGNLDTPPYEAEYLPTEKRNATAGVNPKLEILLLDKSRTDTIDDKNFYLSEIETEAYYLAKRIIEIHNSKMLIKKGKAAMPCDWNDFAVLMRAGTNQSVYERIFRNFGIPYQSIQQKGLFKDAPVNDIYAMLKLLIYPEDIKTYAQVLRSPFVNLDDDAFAIVLLNFKTAFDVKLAEKLSKQNKETYLNACNLFESIKQNALTMNCAELLTTLWYNEGYRYFLLSKDENIRYLELYDYIFELAQQADLKGLTLQQFIDVLSDYILEEESLDDIDIPIERKSCAVSFLTAHKSKGLEFPIVIIPNANYAGIPVKKENVFYSPEFGIVVYTPKTNADEKNIIFESMRDESNKKLIAEAKRLFYVAATRAESYLIISAVDDATCKPDKKNGADESPAEPLTDENGLPIERSLHEIKKIFIKQQESKKEEALPKSFIRMLIPAIPDDNTNILFTEMLPQKRNVLTLHRLKETSERLNFAERYKNAKIKQFTLAKKKIIAATQAAKKELKPSEERVYAFTIPSEELHIGQSGTFTPAQLGTIAHEAIEAKLLQREFIYPEGSQKKVSAWVDNFFNSEFYALAKNAVKIYPEYAFLTEYEHQTISGQIDLMFQTKDYVYIIDYKTDEVEIPENHKTQLSIYKKAAGDLISARRENLTVRAYIFYLKSGNFFEV